MTPVPFTKTPVNVALAPAVMVAELATKLVMEGTRGGGGGVVLDEPPQPIRLPIHTLSDMANATGARIRFIVIPVFSKFRRIWSPK